MFQVGEATVVQHLHWYALHLAYLRVGQYLIVYMFLGTEGIEGLSISSLFKLYSLTKFYIITKEHGSICLKQNSA